MKCQKFDPAELAALQAAGLDIAAEGESATITEGDLQIDVIHPYGEEFSIDITFPSGKTLHARTPRSVIVRLGEEIGRRSASNKTARYKYLNLRYLFFALRRSPTCSSTPRYP